jgi:DNA-binding transcriptional ArsR family regulator
LLPLEREDQSRRAGVSRIRSGQRLLSLDQALSDPTRRQIVEVLRGGEHAVNDIVAKVKIHQSGVSRHLGILAQMGFVQMRPDGSQRFYSLRAEPFRELDAWVSAYRTLWEVRLDQFGEALRKKQRARVASRGKKTDGQG